MTPINNLVTGAAGHIGNVLTRTLLARGQTVRALLLPGESRAPLAGQHITFGKLLTYVQQITQMQHIRITLPAPLIMPAAHLAPIFYRLTHSTPRVTPYAIETVLSNAIISSEKARRELGYAPRSRQDSIRDTVQWFAQNP